MKKFLKAYTPLLVVALVYIIWNIIVLVAVKPLNNAGLYYWSGYGFMSAAFFLVAGSLFALKLKKEITFSVVLPSYVAVGVYFVLCLIMNSVLMGLHHYTIQWAGVGSTGTWVPNPDHPDYNVAGAIVPNVLLLLVFAIMFLIAYRGVIHVGDNAKKVNQKVASLKLVVVELNQIAALTQDAELKTALLALRDDADYSDPMGVEGTAALEEEFKKMVAEIRMLVEGNYEASLAADKINAAKNKLQQRNETLKALK